MNEEKQAERLARWLDSPESDDLHDIDLDDDVVEALTALRPDLAPGPRLTADDILASLTDGPLAERQRSLVTGPIGAPEPANRPMARRWWTAAGGAGGIGLALAAAAALLLEVRADLAPPSPEASAPLQEAAAPADLPSKRDLGPPEEEGTNVASPSQVAVTAAPPELKQAPPEWAAGASVAEPKLADKAAKPMEPLPPATVARSSPVLDDAVVDADTEADAERAQTGRDLAKDEQYRYMQPQFEANSPAAPAAGPPADDSAYGGLVTQEVTADESKRKSSPKPAKESPKAGASQGSFQRAEEQADMAEPVRAAPPPPPPPPPQGKSSADAGWSAGLDGQTLARFEAARSGGASLAAAGDYAGAATTVGAVVGAPARAGQHHAAIAARYWIQAGDPDRAAAVARQGLALSSADTPERRALLALLQAIEAEAR